MSDRLELTSPLHLDLISDGYGEFPDTYAVNEEGLKHIKEYLKDHKDE